MAAGALATGLEARPPELAERLLAAVDDPQDLSLLQEMVRVRSYSGGGEEGRLAEMMVERMKALGLEARLQEVGVGWSVDPLAGLADDEFVYGIGVSNMKASCACLLGAARVLVRSGIRLRGDLLLA
jgi:acetylornithine deacetylase